MRPQRTIPTLKVEFLHLRLMPYNPKSPVILRNPLMRASPTPNAQEKTLPFTNSHPILPWPPPELWNSEVLVQDHHSPHGTPANYHSASHLLRLLQSPFLHLNSLSPVNLPSRSSCHHAQSTISQLFARIESCDFSKRGQFVISAKGWIRLRWSERRNRNALQSVDDCCTSGRFLWSFLLHRKSDPSHMRCGCEGMAARSNRASKAVAVHARPTTWCEPWCWTARPTAQTTTLGLPLPLGSFIPQLGFRFTKGLISLRHVLTSKIKRYFTNFGKRKTK